MTTDPTKTAPTPRNIESWLRSEIAYLDRCVRTPYGDGKLAFYKAVLREVEAVSAD
jgi:hypothetical protein